jgi:hypothetical protein
MIGGIVIVSYTYRRDLHDFDVHVFILLPFDITISVLSLSCREHKTRGFV